MKKLSLLFAGMFVCLYGLLAHGNHHYSKNSNIELRAWNNSSFEITFDNKTYAKTNRFGLRNISPGLHYMEVIQHIPNKYGNGGMRKVLYVGKINIPKNAEVKATIKPNKKLVVQSLPINNHHYPSHQPQCGFDNGYSCSCVNDYGCDNDGYLDDFYPNNGYQPLPMAHNDFNKLLQVVENKNFDSEKLLIIEQAIIFNYFNTEQAYELMTRFTFDSNKLKLAKSIYPNVIDSHNFYLVNDLFTFNSSIKELNDYIINYG